MTITHAELEQMIAHAIEVNAREGITGWGIYNPNPFLFEMIEIGGATGCDSDTCNHHSHDAAAPTYKIVLRDNAQAMIHLGGGGDDEYYAIVSKRRAPGDLVYFVRVRSDRAYYDRVDTVDAKEVPAWCLMNLARKRAA